MPSGEVESPHPRPAQGRAAPARGRLDPRRGHLGAHAPLPPQPRGDLRGDAAAAGAAAGGGRHAARLPRQDALPALDHPVLREHRAGSRRPSSTRRPPPACRPWSCATRPIIHTFAGLTPRQSIRAVLSGHEPRLAPAPHDEARPHRHRHAPARPAHREDPGPPGHRGGPAPARAHRRRGLRHRGPGARQPAAPVQERLRDRAPGEARPDRARRRGRARWSTCGRRWTAWARSASATAARPPPTPS